MPIFESCCTVESCDLYCVPVEHYYHNRNAKDEPCEKCGGENQRLPSKFRVIWSGDLDRFNDPNCANTNQIQGGHIGYRVRSTENADGSPMPVRITNNFQQREFCRQEGLVHPAESNPNLETRADGMVSSSRPKGAWV